MNFLQYLLPLKFNEIQELHKSLELSFEQDEISLSVASKYVDYISRVMILFEDMAAAIWASNNGTLKDFEQNIYKFGKRGYGNVEVQFGKMYSSRSKKELRIAFGFPIPAELRDKNGLSKSEYDMFKAITDETVHKSQVIVKALAHLQKSFREVYLMNKHSSSSLLLNLQPLDNNVTVLAVHKNADPPLVNERGITFAFSKEMVDIWLDAAGLCVQIIEVIYKYKPEQINYLNELIIPSNFITNDEALKKEYQKLFDKLHLGKVHGTIELNLNLRIRIKKKTWLINPLDRWHKLLSELISSSVGRDELTA